MNMKPSIAAIRAITAEFARQFVQPFIWLALGVIACLIIIVLLLAINLSAWWWLLAIPVVILGIAMTTIWLMVRLILAGLSPRLDSTQKTATVQFVAKLQFAKDTIQTPYPMIIFYVIRDIIFRRDKGFLSEVTEHSRTLKPDFDALKELF
jgi:c-di-AMP phosphodiesterase-like protein